MTPLERATRLVRGPYVRHMDLCWHEDLEDLEVLVAEVIFQAILQEREECAKVCEAQAVLLDSKAENWDNGFTTAAKFCARAIRDRK